MMIYFSKGSIETDGNREISSVIILSEKSALSIRFAIGFEDACDWFFWKRSGFFGCEGRCVWVKVELLPPLPVNLLLMFMRLESSFVFLFSGE